MFYSDFMKFVGGRQTGGIPMPQLYKEMFPSDIGVGIQKFASSVAYPHLDFSVIDAFVNSEYFLFNSVNSLFRAPRSVNDKENPYDERTKSLL
jgi:hypothetical protein